MRATTATTAGTAATAGTSAAPAGPVNGAGARRAALLVVALLLVLLGLAACGGDATGAESAVDEVGLNSGRDQTSGDAASAPDGAAEPEAASGGGAAAPEEGAEDDGDAADAVLPGAGSSGGTGRRVVTSSIDVAVEDVAAAAVQVRTLAVRVGGEVAGESSTSGVRPRAEIVLRVPSTDAPGVLTDVAALGEEVARTADSEPVETRLVDLESRTATQRAGVERIRALLSEATTLQDVLALETELTRRQADLESVDAQRAALSDLAALATVTVRLTTPEDVERPEQDLSPFLQGLYAGWEALGASTTIVLVVLGGMLPFAVVAAVVGGAVMLALRALRGRRPAVPTAERARVEQGRDGA